MPRKGRLSPSQKQGRASRSRRRTAQPLVPGTPAWVHELEQWERAPYDGIKGFPPEWVPEPHREAFSIERAMLCSLVCDGQASYADIRAWFDSLVEDRSGRQAIILMLLKNRIPHATRYADPLRNLAWLYQAISLGEIEGLRRLAGENAVAGFRARTGYQKRKSTFHKPEIQQIAKNHWATNPTAIVKDILACEEFRTYMKDKKPYADRTIQNWLREIDPRPLSSKRGPRS